MLKWNSNEERERLKEEIFSEIESVVREIKENQFICGENTIEENLDISECEEVDDDFAFNMRYYVKEVYNHTDLTDEDKADLTEEEDDEEDEEEIYILNNPFDSWGQRQRW